MKSKTIHKLIQADELLSSGKLRKFVLNSSIESGLVISHFLRAFRGQSDFLSVLPHPPRDEFEYSLEKVRNHLISGELPQAEVLLSRLNPESDVERAELYVEACRLHVFKGQLDQALTISEEALKIAELSELSRMTCFQMRGHCRILQKNFSEAILELKRAILLADTFDHASSAFSARAFLAQAHAEIGERQEAWKTIESLKVHLETLSNDELWADRLLIVIRAEIQFHRIFKEWSHWHSKELEAREIARWLGDNITYSKCEAELAQYGGMLPDETSSTPSVIHFSGWEYLPSRDLILMSFPKKISRLTKSPVSRKILQLLAQGPISADDFFERIWKIKYHSEKHSSHVRATLGKVRKLIPAGALTLEDGMIFLK